MQLFKSIPFHVFQDHCCERRFKYLGVPGYYEVACALARADQCNLRVCPVWNTQNFAPPQVGGHPQPQVQAHQPPVQPLTQRPAHQQQPQHQQPQHQQPQQQQRPPQAGGDQQRRPQFPHQQGPQHRSAQPPSPAAPGAENGALPPAALPAQPEPEAQPEPVAPPAEVIPDASSLRDINLRLKEAAQEPAPEAKPASSGGRRHGRRPQRGRGRG